MASPTDHHPRFAGFAGPNYTQVPDELFDLLLPQLADCELRVLLYIVRRTFGFKREADAISLSQMVSGITTADGRVLDRGTGLSKATVARGLEGLRAKGVIVAERNRSARRGDEPTTYRPRFRDAPAGGPIGRPPVSRPRDTPPVSTARQAVSHPRDTQQTVKQETDFEYSNRDPVRDEGRDGSPIPEQTPAQAASSPSPAGLVALAELVRRRAGATPGGEETAAIRAAMERLARELGDRAPAAASVSRALRLYRASGLGAAAFVDLLYLAKGEVRDRRDYPGKAPRPRNPMAYFFAVVEDRLGLRERANGPAD